MATLSIDLVHTLKFGFLKLTLELCDIFALAPAEYEEDRECGFHHMSVDLDEVEIDTVYIFAPIIESFLGKHLSTSLHDWFNDRFESQIKERVALYIVAQGNDAFEWNA